MSTNPEINPVLPILDPWETEEGQRELQELAREGDEVNAWLSEFANREFQAWRKAKTQEWHIEDLPIRSNRNCEIDQLRKTFAFGLDTRAAHEWRAAKIEAAKTRHANEDMQTQQSRGQLRAAKLQDLSARMQQGLTDFMACQLQLGPSRPKMRRTTTSANKEHTFVALGSPVCSESASRLASHVADSR